LETYCFSFHMSPCQEVRSSVRIQLVWLSNYWRNFNETSQEWPVPSLDVNVSHTLRSLRKMATRATNRKVLSGFHRSNTCGISINFTGVISIIPSCANHQHVLLCCTNLSPELWIENSLPAFTGDVNKQKWSVPSLVVYIAGMFRCNRKILSDFELHMRFQWNYTGVTSTIPICAHHRHIPLCWTKWPSDL
jgi:hypothetical protein